MSKFVEAMQKSINEEPLADQDQDAINLGASILNDVPVSYKADKLMSKQLSDNLTEAEEESLIAQLQLIADPTDDETEEEAAANDKLVEQLLKNTTQR